MVPSLNINAGLPWQAVVRLLRSSCVRTFARNSSPLPARALSHSLVRRALTVLTASDGIGNGAISRKIGLPGAMVGPWRKRFIARGVMGLYDERRPGGPRSIEDERVSAPIKKTLETKPRSGTRWTCRSIAAETRLGKSTVQRVWRAFGVQPHRLKHFKRSTDPFFVEKVRT